MAKKRRRPKGPTRKELLDALTPFANFPFMQWQRLMSDPRLFIIRRPDGTPPDQIGYVEREGVLYILHRSDFDRAKSVLGKAGR